MFKDAKPLLLLRTASEESEVDAVKVVAGEGCRDLNAQNAKSRNSPKPSSDETSKKWVCLLIGWDGEVDS
jgi:hypothetical protein